MAKILITGAGGFVGRYCVPRFVGLGWQVHAVSTQPRRQSPNNVVWHQANLLDAAEIRELVLAVRPSHLLHLAWNTSPRHFWKSAENPRWMERGIVLLNEFKSAGGKRAVIVGSCAEYDWKDGHCDEKTTPLRPSTVYGQCKHALQVYTEAFCQTNELSYAWPRLFYLYGPHAHPSRFPGPIIGALLGRQAAPCSHGQQLRDYLYVEDACDALTTLVVSDLTGPINIASGTPISLESMIREIANQLGATELLDWGAVEAANEPDRIIASTDRIRQELGWQPSVCLEGGIKRTIAWWKEQCRTG